MTKEYPLEIITPNGKLFDGSVTAVTAPGIMGSFGILAGHAPFLSLLNKGTVKITTTSDEKIFALNSGVLEVNPESQVLILADKVIACSSAEDAKTKLAEAFT